MSIGRPGQAGSREVQEAYGYVVKTALKLGVHPRPGIAFEDRVEGSECWSWAGDQRSVLMWMASF